MTSFAKGGWKSLVRAVAPALATALGTPLAGLAVAAISDAVLGKPDGSEQEVEAALAVAGPDVLLRLKDADRAFTLRMRELDIDLENQKVTTPSGRQFGFDIEPFSKHCLMNGLDEIGLTLQHADHIRAFETKHRAVQPWLFL